MKRNFLFSIFYFLFSIPVFAQTLPETAVDQIKKATVFIKVKHQFVLSDDEITSSGSGFFINEKGWVATNYHVIQSSLLDYSGVYPTQISQIKIIRNSGTSEYKAYNAIIVSVDKENDLAILAIDDTARFPFIEADTSKQKELNAVWIFGYPFGEEFTVLQRGPEITVGNGSISALRHDDRNELSRIQVDAVINYGNSGGPVVNEKGKAIGIINSMMGSSRINFAVPAHYLQKMLLQIPADFRIADSTRVTLKIIPPDALVFSDYENITGKINSGKCFLKNGLHTLIVMRKKHESAIKEVSCTGEYSDTIALAAEKNLLIPASEKGDKENTSDNPKLPLPSVSSDILLKENFDDNKRFETWEQNTGGEKKRTWYLEDGKLYQYENNETLHAIYIGEKTWGNYTIRARVKISNEGGTKEDDSRAGIIFRETDDGFYLLRLHKESNKAQLAYHCKKPFGWFILAEKKLDEDIVTGKWYHLSATVQGSMISCFLGNQNLFYTSASYSSAGRVGFYSVESKPVFDSLTVVSIKNIVDVKAQPVSSLVSFWFSDNFDLKSTWWHQYKTASEGEAELSPFYMVDGAFALTQEQDFFQSMEFTKYILRDFVLNASLSLDKGKEDAVFEVFSRKDGQNKLLLRFEKKNSKLFLIQHENGKEKILKEKTIASKIFGSHLTLIIKADGNTIAAGSVFSEWLTYESGKIPLLPGRIGFSAKGVRLVFHQLTISSIAEQKEKGEK